MLGSEHSALLVVIPFRLSFVRLCQKSKNITHDLVVYLICTRWPIMCTCFSVDKVPSTLGKIPFREYLVVKKIMINSFECIFLSSAFLCYTLHFSMGVTAEMLRPFLEGWTVKQIVDAKRLFIVDHKILEDLPTRNDRPVRKN